MEVIQPLQCTPSSIVIQHATSAMTSVVQQSRHVTSDVTVTSLDDVDEEELMSVDEERQVSVTRPRDIIKMTTELHRDQPVPGLEKVSATGDAVKPSNSGRNAIRSPKIQKVAENCPGECAPQVEETGRDFKRETESRLRDCVIHHQTLIKLTTEMESVFKEILEVTIVYNALLGMAAFYVSTLAKNHDAKLYMIGTMMMCAVSELLFMCWFAGNITIESSRLGDAAYSCDWLDCTDGFKRSLRIFMSRGLRPVIIRAAGIPLSRVTFHEICRTAYYCHTVVRNLYHGEKINASPL